MKEEYVKKIVSKIKRAINEKICKQAFDTALELISLVASLLYMTNIKYVDEELEKSLKKIASSIKINDLNTLMLKNDTILFWDGFGINDRGLVQIYLLALCKVKNVVYVTYEDRKDQLPDVDRILNQYNAKKKYIKRDKKSILNMIAQLDAIVGEFLPQKFFFYSFPDDVVATTLLYAYEGIITRYQINLTDHAFWLGAGCCDICINFRSYGAIISKEYRGISEEKNVIIPFYPIVHRERAFQGFPFEVKSGQKIMFSGGALYKTQSEDNRYYIMVDHILSKYQNVIFWYAGTNGDDTKLKEILERYPDRAFHTEERTDLFQVLEHCNVYLSTYPMCGGLMFQYAAMAGIVPVTLKHGNISDDFLIDQESLNVEFSSEDELFDEIDKLLLDSEYAEKRREIMQKSVISPNVFELELQKCIEGQNSDVFITRYEHIDTSEFIRWYLTRLSKIDIDILTVRRKGIGAAIKYHPISFFRGGFNIAWKIFKSKVL